MFLRILGVVLLALPLLGQAAEENTDVLDREPLGFREATWLGVVEGVTEFLPVSSTGHLVLAAEWLGLNDETPWLDEKGEVIWVRPPTADREGRPLTTKEAMDTYNVILQGATILAVVFLYWRTLRRLLLGLLKRDRLALRQILNLGIAFVPILPVGVLISPYLGRLFQTDAVAWGLLVGSLAIVVVELGRRQVMKRQGEKGQVGENSLSRWGNRGWEELTHGQALLIGVCQCAAVFPGFSRALAAILGGYLAGLRPGQAAEFSFLVGLPTVLAASVYSGWRSGDVLLQVASVGPMVWGALVSVGTAVLAIWWLRNHIRRWGLWGFAAYRALLAVAVLFWAVG